MSGTRRDKRQARAKRAARSIIQHDSRKTRATNQKRLNDQRSRGNI